MLSIRFLFKYLSVALVIFTSVQSWAADVKVGESLFKAQCASCHNKNMKDKMTGPALGGAQERWGDEKALYQWIRNSQGMIAAGNPKANELWAQFKPNIMTAFPNLKDEEIANILAYVDGVYKGTLGPAVATTGGSNVAGTSNTDSSSNWWVIGAIILLALLALSLTRLVYNLNAVSEAKEGEIPASKSFADILTSKSVIGFVVFALIVLGGYTTVNNAISLGRQQGYQPDQPIKFSHATHAGLHKIDCQYCHDGARRSKQSVIPAANTCMNCHKAIKKGSKYGTEEITKIYASIGFDPNTDKYIDNYDKMSEEDISKIYKKWITEMSPAGTSVENQWTSIKESLTNEHKTKIQGPIQWNRIHNLPDHVYFNHSQHVAVGKVACQKCHGEVEKMEKLKQVAPLSMGWCVNCHRETDVNFKDNEYYKTYQTYHNELKAGTRTKVTVADIGGLECQKCHY
ncbi:MAG: c-type cytochrome [Saprospiraceae bacterium]|nr:c-type cytochrome [Saprospiraceae bacterium]